jgi:tungstate transport system ATP-binding protein
MTAMRDTPSILPITAEGLVFEANGKRLIDGISVSLPKGGITAMIGPNGAGKSLTLRLLHGLITPTAGVVSWHGHGGLREGRRAHAMVFQRPVMLRRSARDNLVHALAASRIADPGKRADQALARFGLAALAKAPARLLSGGEQQRLAIARAAALEPELLFLDEPTANLDPGATRQVEALIRDLAETGITILMTTHDLGQARRHAARTLFLHRGRLVEDAPTARFFSGPRSEEARAFIAGDLLW